MHIENNYRYTNFKIYASYYNIIKHIFDGEEVFYKIVWFDDGRAAVFPFDLIFYKKHLTDNCLCRMLNEIKVLLLNKKLL